MGRIWNVFRDLVDEDLQMLEQRNEALMSALKEIDYLLTYGLIKEARLLINEITGEEDA